MDKEHKSKEYLKELAARVVDSLRPEGLPLWQAKEVLTYAKAQLDWEPLKEKERSEKTIDEMIEELNRAGMEVVKLCSNHIIKDN